MAYSGKTCILMESFYIISKKTVEKRMLRDQLSNQPHVVVRLLEASCKHYSLEQSIFEENMHRKTVLIERVIKLFSYWTVEIVGFSAVFIGKILQRSNTAVLRAAQLGRNLADIPFPIPSY